MSTKFIIPYRFLALLCSLLILAACDNSAGTSQVHNKQSHQAQAGSITYSTSLQDVLIRTFYGGGNLGTFEVSPDISIYGNGSYILGPGLQMQEGKLDTASLQQLLHTLVDSDGLLRLNRQQFYDVPDQNATLLQLALNGKHYEFLYGQFGNLQENAQDLDEYHRLGKALTSIRNALQGPTFSYQGTHMALLVHQDFSPDLTQNIPGWTYPDFTLTQVATYECGPTPQDVTGPNADSGCLTFTIPHKVLLLTPSQLKAITPLLSNQQQGVFLEQGRYYIVAMRSLLPDELPVMMLAMFGSQESSYTGVHLDEGPIPTVTP